MKRDKCWVGLDADGRVMSVSVAPNGKEFVSDGGLTPHLVDYDIAVFHFDSDEPLIIEDESELDLDAILHAQLSAMRELHRWLRAILPLTIATSTIDEMATAIPGILARLDPPVLFCHPHELAEESR